MTINETMTILQGLTDEQLALLAAMLPLIEAARPRADRRARSKPPERRSSK